MVPKIPFLTACSLGKKKKKKKKTDLWVVWGIYFHCTNRVNIPWNEDIKKSKNLYRKFLKFETPRTIAVLISCNKNVSKNVHGMINSDQIQRCKRSENHGLKGSLSVYIPSYHPPLRSCPLSPSFTAESPLHGIGLFAGRRPDRCASKNSIDSPRAFP